MKLFKKLSKSVKRASRSVVRTASGISEKTVDIVADVGEKTVDVGKDVGEATVDIAKKTGETGKKVGSAVGKTVIKVTAPVVEIIDEIDHFAKTGDFGHAIVKLQEEQDKEQTRLDTAELEFAEVAREHIAAVLKRRSLSVLHELEAEVEIKRAQGVDVEKIDADLYNNGRIRMVERLGLDEVALGMKFMSSIIPAKTPHELVTSQVELAKIRKQLRQNISALRKSTSQIKRNTANLVDQTVAIEDEIEVLEDKVNALNLDPNAHGATLLRDAEVQNAVALEMARELLAAGLTPADIAAATGLDVDEVGALLGEG